MGEETREVNGTRDSFSVVGRTSNDAVAAQIAAAWRRRLWRIVIVASVIALVAAVVGGLFMMRTQSVRKDVACMRNELGETLTSMIHGDANQAVARHLPAFVDAVGRWDRKFAERMRDFRGLDTEINAVQTAHRDGETAERWRRELENVSPTQRGALWQKSVKAQAEEMQKRYPNVEKVPGWRDWLKDIWKEFGFGLRHGLLWPVGIFQRLTELVRGGSAVSRLDFGDCLHYLIFPYRLSTFTLLCLVGIALVTVGFGYLLCWVGLKTRLSALSYVGLLYFLYLFNIAFFIVWHEVTK